MRKTIRMAAALVLTAAALSAAPAKFTPHEFVAADGTKVRAEIGEIAVPENRSKDDSRSIKLRFVRFRSTSPRPGHPIVYLAGGPGGSGVGAARGSRFPLFMALREHGDVIAWDQRGINRSEPDMHCTEQYVIPPGHPLDRAKAGAVAAAALRQCVERLRATGVDLAGYNTRESAADLEDLRKALGAEKLVLWGISYGTHLAIAALRYHPGSVDRVILAGIEGPDDSYKLPGDQQTLIEDIARLAAQDGKSRDLVASIGNVLRELEARPKTVSLTHPINGMTADFVLGKFDLQVALAGMLTGPDSFAVMPDFISRVESGDWTALGLAAGPRRFGSPGSAMAVAMDCSSGISVGRRQRIAEEARGTLLGDAINAPFPEICAGAVVPDAGDAFRGPIVSSVPALLISGTLDGRTRPRQADELRLTMPNAEHLVIEGAGHSDPLFLSTPKILEAMKAFLRGEPLRERYVAAPPVAFIPVRRVATVSDEVLARYVGSYRIDEKSTRRVLKAGSVLYTIREGSPPFAIRPSSETEFFYEVSGSSITFERDASGKVVAMLFRTPDGQTQRAVRE
ncbi:MAG TPA: alpha/beta fold hydrolase [Thermoanaerobaculia bacterium]|nr:alpha/beta fold hydrolase [Thermoanaerobaculia bacterium]